MAAPNPIRPGVGADPQRGYHTTEPWLFCHLVSMGTRAFSGAVLHAGNKV